MKLKFKTEDILTKDGVSFVIPFILITTCFAMWGFANDMTGPIVKAFSKIFRMSVTEGSMVQVAYYLGYFAMAFPAALFIQRYSFKAGVLVGLSLFAVGSLMFVPAKMMGYYLPFLMAYFILTCGLSFLETSCNPFIYCMGSEETATQRLNLAQAFNPMGALLGMFVAMDFVQARMSPMTSAQRYELPDAQFNLLKDHDLNILIQPYIVLGAFCIVLLLLIRLSKMPMAADTKSKKGIVESLRELMKIRNYREGVLAQFFYVGAQVTCWTFIIQYGTRVFMAEGMDEKAAEILSQKYNILAMVFFSVSRFVCTFFLKYIPAGRLLSILAICAAAFAGGVILFPDRNGIYCLVAVSSCMSLMFPTIYGIALRGVGDNVKMAGAGLIMAILGGSVFPPIQALIIDADFSLLGLSSTNISFIVPFSCFIVIALYGHKAYVRHYILKIN
jgi:FHS family L-fucose permease-like MFS transporter